MGSASGMMSGQQAAANFWGLKLGTMVFLSPSYSREQWEKSRLGCTVQQPLLAIKLAPGRSRAEEEQTASPWAVLAAWIDQAWEITEGFLKGRQPLQQREFLPKPVLGADASWWAVSWGGELWEDKPSNFTPQATFRPGELVSWWNLRQPAP